MRNQDFYDRMQILEFLLQIITVLWATEDVSNNKLFEELQRQNKQYLETIIDQNNKIIEYLSNMHS